MQAEQHQLEDNDGEAFQELVSNLLIMTEELRRHVLTTSDVTIEACLHWRHEMEGIMHHLHHPVLQNASTDDVQLDLRQHVQQRAKDVFRMALDSAVTKTESSAEENVVTYNSGQSEPPINSSALQMLDSAAMADMERDCQSAIARMAELNLIMNILVTGTKSTSPGQPIPAESKLQFTQEIVDLYASYQRQVLRQRAKPAIAGLVEQRKQQQIASTATSQYKSIQQEDNDEEDESAGKSQHAHVITAILGQASALIHPLMTWRSNLPPPPSPPAIDSTNGSSNDHGITEDPICHAVRRMCDKAIATLDEQAQSLTKTVATWMLEDRHVDAWMNRQSAESTDHDNKLKMDLNELDALVEELAFACQVLARYVALVEPSSSLVTSNSGASTTAENVTIFTSELQPELNWKYASLERYLVLKQWRAALDIANPVRIVLGTAIQVPSVVEDAQYVSTRALERASSTRSTQAIGTVAHAIASDVWSTDIDGGVHQALLDEKGCWQDPTDTKDAQPAAPGTGARSPVSTTDTKSGNSFASALLGALDDDLSAPGAAASNPATKRSNSKPPSAPSSGNFLATFASFGVLGGDRLPEIRLDTSLCALNGIHSASAACSSLASLLDSLLPNNEDEDASLSRDGQAAETMIQLAREELCRFAKMYQALLQSQVSRLVSDWCGSVEEDAVYKGPKCFPILRFYLDRESYELSGAPALTIAEDDARITKHLIQPLEDSDLLSQLEKCDSDVLTAICEQVASVIVEVVLDCLKSTILPKRFTDWGSLLLSKQVRLLQQFLSNRMESVLQGQDHHGATPILSSWERLNQVVTLLQLERPSDWTYYQASSVLSTDELHTFMSLRVDFSRDAIVSVVSSLNNTNTNKNST